MELLQENIRKRDSPGQPYQVVIFYLYFPREKTKTQESKGRCPGPRQQAELNAALPNSGVQAHPAAFNMHSKRLGFFPQLPASRRLTLVADIATLDPSPETEGCRSSCQ